MLIFAIFFAAILSDEPKIDQVVCDRHFFTRADEICCVSKRKNQKPLVQVLKIEAGSFVEVKRFIASHANIEEIAQNDKNIYCMYHNGVVERRRLDAPEVPVSALKLESKHENVQGMLSPDHDSDGPLLISSSRDFTGPGSDFSTWITRASLGDSRAALVWEIKGSFRFYGERDASGFYLVNEHGDNRTLQKRDFATGNVVAQLGCEQKWPTLLRDGTLVFSGGGSHEFWDFDNRILKRTVVIPDSEFRGKFMSVRSRDGVLEFVDYSGKPIPKYARIDTEKNELVFSIQEDKVILRNFQRGVFRIVDMVSKEQVFDKKKAYSVYLMPKRQVLVIETVDANGNFVEPPGGCAPPPYPRYRLSILPQNAPATRSDRKSGVSDQ